MESYLDVIYNASENRARKIDQEFRHNLHTNIPTLPVPEGTGYFIYYPNTPAIKYNNSRESYDKEDKNRISREYDNKYDKEDKNRISKEYDDREEKNRISKRKFDDKEEKTMPYKRQSSYYISRNGFNNKISEILKDLPKYTKIFTDNDKYFKDMLRPRENISLLFQEITEDLINLKNKNYSLCKHANDCLRKECCAFLNPEDILKIINAYKSFDIEMYEFKYYKRVLTASIALKSLEALHDATWDIFSRKKIANHIISENISKK